jgi:hypothetical protein
MSRTNTYTKGNDGPSEGTDRVRPTRTHLLDLIASNGRASLQAAAICQTHCSHCYAGHCGSSCGSSIEAGNGRPN